MKEFRSYLLKKHTPCPDLSSSRSHDHQYTSGSSTARTQPNDIGSPRSSLQNKPPLVQNLQSLQLSELRDQVKVIANTNKALSDELFIVCEDNAQLKKNLESSCIKLKLAEETWKDMSRLTELLGAWAHNCNVPNSIVEKMMDQANLINRRIGEYSTQEPENQKTDQELQIETKPKSETMKQLDHKYTMLEFQQSNLNIQLETMKQTLRSRESTINTHTVQINNQSQKEKLLKQKIKRMRTELHKKETSSKIMYEKFKFMRNELAQYQRKIAELENEFTEKISSVQKTNDHLSREVKLLKEKRQFSHNQIKKLNRKLQENAPLSSRSSKIEIQSQEDQKVLLDLKRKIEKAYRGMLSEIERQVEGDCSFYSMNSCHFGQIEKRINQVLVMLHEQLEASSLRPVKSLPQSKCHTPRTTRF